MIQVFCENAIAIALGLAVREVSIRCAALFDVLEVEDASDDTKVRLKHAADAFALTCQSLH